MEQKMSLYDYCEYGQMLAAEVRRRYPDSPGSKDQDTSVKAAESLDKDKICAIHQEILEIICEGMTTEEVIDILWMQAAIPDNGAFTYAKQYHAHATYIKPRVTEMLRLGMIRDSGTRRDTFSGNKSKVWVRL